MRYHYTLNKSYNIERLPESVSDLENLWALLRTRWRRLMYVPCLAKLSKLRVLDLYKNCNLEKAPEGIERLKCLEKITYCPWDIYEITGFNNLIHSLPSLSCYRFLLCNQVCFETASDCGGQMNLLCLGGVEIEDDNTSILLPPRINKLMIVESVVKRSNVEDVFPTLGLPTELRDLFIRNCKGLKYILSSSSLGPQQGPFFKYMTLKDLPDLRGIIEFGGFTFSHLHCLKIEDCPKIKVIFPHMVNQLSLPNLNDISVSDCRELEEIFESNNGHHLNSAFGLPNLFTLKMKGLPKLRRLGMNLHLCTSLEHLEIYDCEELEEIFESGGRSSETETLGVDHINVCNPQPSPNPISFLPKLKFKRLLNLPKLGSIYKELHLCTSLEELQMVNCPKIERIFWSPKPIFTLCKLGKLKLQGLPKLSSIHRGLLFCTSLEEFSIECCIKMKRVPLSNHLMWDNTPSSLLSLPSDSEDPDSWELLRCDYSEDARLLYDFIQYHVQLQQHNHHQNQFNLENDACNLTDNIDQVSVPASLIPDADQLLLPQLVLTENEQYQIRRSWGASLSLS